LSRKASSLASLEQEQAIAMLPMDPAEAQEESAVDQPLPQLRRCVFSLDLREDELAAFEFERKIKFGVAIWMDWRLALRR
jgi:hypothetical protein